MRRLFSGASGGRFHRCFFLKRLSAEISEKSKELLNR